jgi:membrane fusion protein, multidrug efflux system
MVNFGSLVGLAATAYFSCVSMAQAEPLRARGVVKALTEATVAVDYAASIRRMPKLEGQSFKAGDVLISFDCRRYSAEVGAAAGDGKQSQAAVTRCRWRK